MLFANHVVSPIPLLGCDPNFKRQTGMWSLSILSAYSEWPVPTAESQVSEFIPADLNHCHLCRRTHSALVWTELRTVSGTVPEKKLQAVHPSEYTCKLQFGKPAEESGGDGLENTSTIKPQTERAGWRLGCISLRCQSRDCEFSADYSANRKCVMGKKLRSSFLFVSITYLRHLWKYTLYQFLTSASPSLSFWLTYGSFVALLSRPAANKACTAECKGTHVHAELIFLSPKSVGFSSRFFSVTDIDCVLMERASSFKRILHCLCYFTTQQTRAT